MRVYKLAAPYHRSYVDLRDFKDIIEQAVHKEVPDAKVVVKEECYEIDKDISKGDAIRIGRTLASGELGQYCLQRANLLLFTGRYFRYRKYRMKVYRVQFWAIFHA